MLTGGSVTLRPACNGRQPIVTLCKLPIGIAASGASNTSMSGYQQHIAGRQQSARTAAATFVKAGIDEFNNGSGLAARDLLQRAVTHAVGDRSLHEDALVQLRALGREQLYQGLLTDENAGDADAATAPISS